MKKFTVLLLAVLVIAAILSGCRPRQQQQGGQQAPRVFQMACNHSADYPTNVGNRAFIEYVERETNGRIRIELFHSEQLGSESQTVELTQLGEVAFNRLGVAFLASVNPEIGAFSMPFLYRDRAHMFRVLDGPLGDEALRMLERQGLLGLCWYDSGSRNFYTTGRPIRTLEDMRGMRIRVMPTPVLRDMTSVLGASPVPMGMGEVYSGIQNGVVDGAENNWPSYYSWSHYEVAEFFTLSGHMAAPEMILVSTTVWNTFSAGDQAIIKRAALHAAQVQRADWLRFEREAEQAARAAGTTVFELSPAEHQRFVDALAPMFQMAEWAAVAPLVNRIRAIQ